MSLSHGRHKRGKAVCLSLLVVLFASDAACYQTDRSSAVKQGTNQSDYLFRAARAAFIMEAHVEWLAMAIYTDLLTGEKVPDNRLRENLRRYQKGEKPYPTQGDIAETRDACVRFMQEIANPPQDCLDVYNNVRKLYLLVEDFISEITDLLQIGEKGDAMISAKVDKVLDSASLAQRQFRSTRILFPRSVWEQMENDLMSKTKKK